MFSGKAFAQSFNSKSTLSQNLKEDFLGGVDHKCYLGMEGLCVLFILVSIECGWISMYLIDSKVNVFAGLDLQTNFFLLPSFLGVAKTNGLTSDYVLLRVY